MVHHQNFVTSSWLLVTNGRTLLSTLASLQRRFRGSSHPTQTTLRCRWNSSSVWWRKTTLLTWPSVSALVSFPTMCEWQAFHGIITFEFGWCIQGWKALVRCLIKICVSDCFLSELNMWVYLAHWSHFPYFTRPVVYLGVTHRTGCMFWPISGLISSWVQFPTSPRGFLWTQCLSLLALIEFLALATEQWRHYPNPPLTGDRVSPPVAATWLRSKDSTPYAPAEVTDRNRGTEESQ